MSIRLLFREYLSLLLWRVGDMDVKWTIRPCQNYITSSGTNGSTLVWDTRSPDAPLVELEHDSKSFSFHDVYFIKFGRYYSSHGFTS